MEGLSAKVFRTYNASITLSNQLYINDDQIFEHDNLDKKFKFYTDCNREVARLCNHQKAIPKNYDESLQKLKAKVDEKREKLRVLEEELAKLKKPKAKASSD